MTRLFLLLASLAGYVVSTGLGGVDTSSSSLDESATGSIEPNDNHLRQSHPIDETLSFETDSDHPNHHRNLQQSSTTTTTTMGRQGLCVIGSSPFVNLNNPHDGFYKYIAVVQEMARTCDVIVHAGDTKPFDMPCNQTTIVRSLNWMRGTATRNNKIALYAPGDSELSHCHRSKSSSGSSSSTAAVSAEYTRASVARKALVELLNLRSTMDLTRQHTVDTHFTFRSDKLVPGTNTTYSCDFDKYVELDHYAVATLEVPGSHWYLDDETQLGYPRQDKVDPLMDRFGMYLNALACTIDWIDQSAKKASANKKRALFFVMNAMFYAKYGVGPSGHPIGDFYSETNFLKYMKDIAKRRDVPQVYQPLFNRLTRIAKEYRDLQIYVVHGQGQRFQTIRLNPNLHNRGTEGLVFHTNHNLMAQMVDGSSRGMTMWVRLTVDPDSFQPVTVKEEWSRDAFNRPPLGHAWVPFDGEL